MQPNTHGEFMSGKDFNAFIDGVPDECEHDWTGEIIHFVSPLRSNLDPEACEYSVKDSEINREDLPGESESTKLHNWDKMLRDQGYYVSGGAVSYAKCGKPFYPSLF